MARQFVAASSQGLVYSGAVLSTYPITISALFNVTSWTANRAILTIGDTDVANYLLLAVVNSGVLVASARLGATTEAAASSIGVTADTWQHGLAVFTSTSNRHVLLDGGNKGTNTNTVAPTGLDVTNIGRSDVGGGSYYHMDGLLAEVGVWAAALTDAEGLELSRGNSPVGVRPQSLVAHWPLIRDTDNDIVGDYSMTAGGSPTVAAHPRVIYPWNVYRMPSPAAGVNMAVMAMHYARMRCNS